MTTANTKEAATTRTCFRCKLAIGSAQSVRALGHFFHFECFTCEKCAGHIADKFFPLFDPEKDPQKLSPKLFCETHFFELHGLICSACGCALRGPHISALGKKFHLEHFACCVANCGKVFRQHDSYYERDDKVYCQFHYSVLFATKCGGCQTAVLKKFVEMKKEGVVYQWHPQCYMIYKLWNVKPNFQHAGIEFNEENPEAEVNRQAITLAKVDKIISVLSVFEESAAAAIGNVMSHYSARSFADVCLDGHKFIEYVDAMFRGLEAIDASLTAARAAGNGVGDDETGLLVGRKEPRHLSKKIVHFFSILSQPVANGEAAAEVVKAEMIQLVTSLASTLKSLIRLALNGALKMERSYGSETAILEFLSLLTNLETNDEQQAGAIIAAFAAMTTSQSNRTDVCTKCHKSVEDACFKTFDDSFCWHSDRALGCFTCTTCGRHLGEEVALVQANTGLLYCANDAADVIGLNQESGGVVIKRVSQLQQFSFLLHCALGRLYTLLHARDAQLDGSPPTDSPLPAYQANLRQNPPPLANSLPNLPITSQSSTLPLPQSVEETSPSDDELHTPQAAQEFRRLAPANPTLREQPHLIVDSARVLSEQTGLARVSIREGAVAALEHILGRRLPELEGEDGKRGGGGGAGGGSGFGGWGGGGNSGSGGLWSRFMSNSGNSSSNNNGNSKRSSAIPVAFSQAVMGNKKGTFGVPLAVLTQLQGVESQVAEGNYSVRIPRFVELCLVAMYNMDLTTEGIFRKNGNIRRLKETAELFDQNPELDRLDEDNVIQVGALLKKFFREMPDPLLTFRLHFLFVASQNYDELTTRKRILHLALCLLPKANLDLLQVLLQFLRKVAQYKDGNKMDVPNLATVMSPNILYAKSGNPGEEQPFLCIRAVQMLIVYQDEFRMIPDEINISSE